MIEDRPRPVSFAERPVRAVWALIAVNAALFALETYWGGSQSSQTLYRMGAIAGRNMLAAEPWRVLSSAFLHIGFAHLLVNMWALWAFGKSLEQLMGCARLLVLYGLSALGGGTLSAIGHDERLAAGASGAVWGLMVAQLVLVLLPRSLFEDLVFQVNKATVFQPLVINLLYSLTPGIDMLGHLGGGAAGGLAMGSRLVTLRPRAAAWRAAAALAVVAMAASIGLALWTGRPWDVTQPVLVTQALGDTGYTLRIPRGLAARRDAKSFVFGSVRFDPMIVECRLERVGAITSAASRDAFLAAEGEMTPGGRPVSHKTLATKNGVPVELWTFADVDGRVLRLFVIQPDLPATWKTVPAEIAASVTFPAAPRGAH
jgi:membrane associated rhomboid family serine protease